MGPATIAGCCGADPLRGRCVPPVQAQKCGRWRPHSECPFGACTCSHDVESLPVRKCRSAWSVGHGYTRVARVPGSTVEGRRRPGAASRTLLHPGSGSIRVWRFLAQGRGGLRQGNHYPDRPDDGHGGQDGRGGAISDRRNERKAVSAGSSLGRARREAPGCHRMYKHIHRDRLHS
jgi:hypothetical protein